MRKALTIFLLLLFHFSFTKAQTWQPLGAGISGTVGIKGYGIWVWALDTFKGNLYVAGGFDSAGGKPARNIAMWNDSTWSTLGSGINSFGVNCLTGYNGNLYAGGNFDSAGGKPANNIAMWDGSTWSAVGNGPNGPVQALLVFNGSLYVSGIFDSAGGMPVNNIAIWDGSNWSALGNGITGYAVHTAVHTLAVYNGILYAGGYFDSAGGMATNNVAEWDGSKWLPLGAGITDSNAFFGGDVIALTAYNGDLYAGGIFNIAGGQPAYGIAFWNGTSWSVIPAFLGYSMEVDCFSSYDGNLYTGGFFDGSTLADNIGEWHRSNWLTLGSGIPGISWNVHALTVFNRKIIASGTFDSAGGILAHNIAEWVVPPNLPQPITSSNSITVFPNPSNGIFTVESGISNQQFIDIYNVLGQKIYSTALTQPLPSGEDVSTKINLSDCSVGIYLYRIISDNGGTFSSGKLLLVK